MNITAALMLFFLLALIYILIIEVFTILFRLTGLTYDKAHFQVISMLTNSGFTTIDSEAITSSKIRRKIAKLTIIFGYLFTVIIMSSVVNIFLSLSNSELSHMWSSAIVVFIAAALLLIINNSNFVKKYVDYYIGKVGKKMMYGNQSNPIILLDIYGDNVMAEIGLTQVPPELESVMLKNSGLKEKYKIQLILIKRDGKTKSILSGDETFKTNDVLVVFGDYKNIKDLFHT